ncbi:NAD(P)-binding domain-containing protein [Nocardia sp. alder85J]|uniref:NAD(P)-binding domain-containing protein n=1 Tax=Nocardia sp. alder85J TaxID=2862949 RepID=UPI001CD75606|nr:NAD(P)-binding domain-containing protein [Nocardia sp. alder85J]MCX4094725.1 NAD(P)-binding domain-containing protein [Nocardia sp. alder85J]
MRYAIIGCGNVGMELARRWTEAGHVVTGTTTTPERIPELRRVCTEVVVTRGSNRTAVARAVDGADAVVLTVSPRLTRAFDAASRVAEYADTLVASARVAADLHERVVFAGSGSVYGAAAVPEVDESTPTTDDPDASPRNFVAAEQIVLNAGRGAVLRIPDVYGHPRDMDYPARVRFAHERLGGSVPFAARALLYRIDYRDAAAALDHVVTHELTGVYNAYPDAVVPPTNEQVFGEICTAAGLPALTYRGEIGSPEVPISSARLRATGFRFAHQ